MGNEPKAIAISYSIFPFFLFFLPSDQAGSRAHTRPSPCKNASPRCDKDEQNVHLSPIYRTRLYAHGCGGLSRKSAFLPSCFAETLKRVATHAMLPRFRSRRVCEASIADWHSGCGNSTGKARTFSARTLSFHSIILIKPFHLNLQLLLVRIIKSEEQQQFIIMLEGSYLATPIRSWSRPTTTPTTPLPTCTIP